MKKIVAIIGSLFVFTGLKAQTTTVKKETVKPVADTAVKANGTNSKQSASTIKYAATQKEATTKAVTQKDAKQVNTIKDAKATVTQKEAKIAPAQTVQH